DLSLSAWPASEHTSAMPRHAHPLVPLLRPSAAVATAGRGTATPRAASTRDRSNPPPSRACRAATPWLSHYPWLERAQPALGVNCYGARRNCDTPGTASVAGRVPLRFYTAWRCAVQWPRPADAG